MGKSTGTGRVDLLLSGVLLTEMTFAEFLHDWMIWVVIINATEISDQEVLAALANIQLIKK